VAAFFHFDLCYLAALEAMLLLPTFETRATDCWLALLKFSLEDSGSLDKSSFLLIAVVLRFDKLLNRFTGDLS
jgi:membrane-associated PAP2 superfamily phosphatase